MQGLKDIIVRLSEANVDAILVGGLRSVNFPPQRLTHLSDHRTPSHSVSPRKSCPTTLQIFFFAVITHIPRFSLHLGVILSGAMSLMQGVLKGTPCSVTMLRVLVHAWLPKQSP